MGEERLLRVATGARRTRSRLVPPVRSVLIATAVAATTLLPALPAGSAVRPPASSVSASPSGTHVKWLCRPGLANDPCTGDLSGTAVWPTGAQTPEPAAPARHPAIDCFYVYPTVSEERGFNANLAIQPAEQEAAMAQASQFSRDCRVYAPVYRQLTLYALAHATQATEAEGRIAYDGVLAAWKSYLAHDNHGRGVVLIGHSQGATILINLIKREIDDHPSVRRRMVSAILLGGNVAVPIGKNVGGSFHHVPACRSATELHCVVAYSSFLQTPPRNTLFGVPGQGVSKLAGGTSGKGLQVLCTNPAALGGGSGTLSPNFPTATFAPGSVPTPWVAYPDMYRSTCEYHHGISWLQVDDVAPPGDHNPALRQFDGPQWGLHVEDVNLALGNLVSLVHSQAAEYRRSA